MGSRHTTAVRLSPLNTFSFSFSYGAGCAKTPIYRPDTRAEEIDVVWALTPTQRSSLDYSHAVDAVVGYDPSTPVSYRGPP